MVACTIGLAGTWKREQFILTGAGKVGVGIAS